MNYHLGKFHLWQNKALLLNLTFEDFIPDNNTLQQERLGFFETQMILSVFDSCGDWDLRQKNKPFSTKYKDKWCRKYTTILQNGIQQFI